LVEAFPCSAAYKEVNDSATKKCANSECSPSECCVEDDTKCGNSKTTQWCDSGKALEVGSAGKNKEECCTLTSVKCDTVTCPTGMKDKSSKDTIDCYGTACSEFQCCDADPDYCIAHSCGSGKYKPASKMTVKGKTDADCCEDEAKCSDFSGCDGTYSWADGATWRTMAPFEADSSKASTTYNPEERPEDISKASHCCKVKDTLCYVAFAGKSCPTGKVTEGAKIGNTADDCCMDAPICGSYAPATAPGGATSGAEFGSERSWVVAGAAVVMATLM
jgi:hypothetical protein